jgi:hypothetical protein
MYLCDMGGCTKLCLAAEMVPKFISLQERFVASFLEEQSGISQFIVISFAGNIR